MHNTHIAIYDWLVRNKIKLALLKHPLVSNNFVHAISGQKFSLQPKDLNEFSVNASSNAVVEDAV